MQVRDIMTTTPATVQSQSSIWEAIQLNPARSVSGLPVVDATGTLVGVLSEGDLLRRVELGTTRPEEGWFRSLFHPGGLAQGYKTAHARTVADVMSLTPITIEPTARLEQAVTLMEEHKIKRLPVTDRGAVVGILSRSDFLRALAPMLAPAYEEQATSDAEIERTIVAELHRQEWAAGTAIAPKAHNGHVTLGCRPVRSAARRHTRARRNCQRRPIRYRRTRLGRSDRSVRDLIRDEVQANQQGTP